MTLAVAKSEVLPITGSDSMAAVRAELDAWLFERAEGSVQSGPFRGMKLSQDKAWKDSRLSPKILGCYEEELHGVLERHITRLKTIERPKIAVIGAAEGYYAIGLKLRVPDADVFIIDSDEGAVVACGRNAAMNEVSLLAGAPLSVTMERPDLLVLDCEGAEVAYLDPEKFPSLIGAHIIVEVHNMPGQKTDEILVNRFCGSHRLNLLFEGPRNPNNYKPLATFSSDYRWMAVSEGRPCLMSWLVMEPKGLHVA